MTQHQTTRVNEGSEKKVSVSCHEVRKLGKTFSPSNAKSHHPLVHRIGMQSNFHLLQIHFNLRPQIRVYSGEEIQFSGRRTRINEIPA